MSTLVNWFLLDNESDARALCEKIGVFCHLCDRSRSSLWDPIYVSPDTENPTAWAMEMNSTLVNRTWTVAATETNNPYGVIAAIGDPLLSEAELALIQEIDFDLFVETYHG